MVLMQVCLCVWRGTAQELIGFMTAAAEPIQARSVSPLSIAGLIMVTLIRLAVCFGRLSKNTAKSCLGRTL